MDAGAKYLRAYMDPSTPPELLAKIDKFADNLQVIAIHTLAGTSNEDPAQSVRLAEGDAMASRIAELCR